MFNKFIIFSIFFFFKNKRSITKVIISSLFQSQLIYTEAKTRAFNLYIKYTIKFHNTSIEFLTISML